MHNEFQVMHYQIYRFTGYLLVHLTLPDFFRMKIYPNLPCVPRTHPSNLFSKLANICPCQLLERRHGNLETGRGLMHLVPQKTVTPLKRQPSVRPAQFENTSPSMTGLAWCSILTPINLFHKKKLLNISQAGQMGPWDSHNLLFLDTCQRKDVKKISRRTQQPCQGKGLGLSHDLMSRGHLFCGWNIWKRNWSMLQEQCWLQSGPSLRTN